MLRLHSYIIRNYCISDYKDLRVSAREDSALLIEIFLRKLWVYITTMSNKYYFSQAIENISRLSMNKVRVGKILGSNLEMISPFKFLRVILLQIYPRIVIQMTTTTLIHLMTLGEVSLLFTISEVNNHTFLRTMTVFFIYLLYNSL